LVHSTAVVERNRKLTLNEWIKCCYEAKDLLFHHLANAINWLTNPGDKYAAHSSTSSCHLNIGDDF